MLEGVRDAYRQLPPALGITPELVMVVEFNDKLANVADVVESAELRVLGATSRTAMAVFSSDPELRSFLDRCARYRTELTPSGKPRHGSLFDAIDRVRSLEPADVVDDDLAARIAGSPDGLIRIDVECWSTEDKGDTERRHADTVTALTNTGATILDRTCRYTVGLSVIRADIVAARILDVVDTRLVSRVCLLPRPMLSHHEIINWPVERIPEVLPPAATSAMVAVIDSGVQAGHPLLSPAVWEAVSAHPSFPDGADEWGHGTLVASLALHGSLEGPLLSGQLARPAGKLLGVRVLDHEGFFPDSVLWQRQLEDAVNLAIRHGARVINLSLGDPAHPYRPPAPTAIAAVLDTLVRQHDVVLVVSAGNVAPAEHSTMDYATRLLHDHRLAPPAMSALALTVGAVVPDEQQGARPARENVAVLPLGKPGWPSPLTRTGPGIEFSIKPELVAPGGSYVYDRDGQRVRHDNARGAVVGADGAHQERLLALDRGTSVAAPLVSHAALRVLDRHPRLSANAVRALVLAAAEGVPTVLEGPTGAAAVRAQRMHSGFGRVSSARAEQSTEHRTVLLAEQQLLPDQVHFYEVPVPAAFHESGAKSLTAALSFDPEVRATRLTYLACRMAVFVYRGCPVDEVRAKFAASHGEPPDGLARHQVDLQPSNRDRVLGANQAATASWTNRWKPGDRNLVVVVRNTNRWAPADELQRYALAVALEVDEGMSAIYAELHARYEALVETRTEIEAEVSS